MNAPARREEAPWENDYWTPDPIWKGEQVFVLASGPSLTREICDKVMGKPRCLSPWSGRKAIVINVSFRLAPWAPVWYFTDSSIYERYSDDVKAWPGHIVTMSKTAKRELNKRVMRVQGWGDPTLPMGEFPPLGSHFIRQGRSSGHTAISLAIALGARRVVMLGYDCRVVDGREHHHAEYTGPRDHDVYAREFAPAYEGWNAAAHKVGVEIVNCTPGSAIKEFPFADLDEVLT